MEYHELKLLLELPPVRLLRAQNAPLLLAFLSRVFKAEPRTLEHFRGYAVTAKAAAYEHVSHLNGSELSAYVAVRNANLLIEQEKIPQAHIEMCLRSALANSTANT